jgi:peptidoglycan-N-acetylglucosamine deacetylase
MKGVYLTIDDGPSEVFFEKLEFLADKQIQCIWFCSGSKLAEKDITKAISAGHILANHAFSHPHFSEISLEQAKGEILKTEELLRAAYRQANVKRAFKLFRFPYGDTGGEHKIELQAFLKAQGFSKPPFKQVTYRWWPSSYDVFWTFSFQDWIFKSGPMQGFESIQDIFRHIKTPHHNSGGSLVTGSSNEVLVLHDHKQNTDEFKQIINRCLELKLRFLRV